jgi:3-mercaptopyruvate sulfurtransferase SseA
MAEQVRFFDGKKFMWDGEEYETEKQASSVEKGYREKDFEVQTYKEEGKVYLYTRRVVTEIVLE